jgi:ligand-binding sensor domain-containing protein
LLKQSAKTLLITFFLLHYLSNPQAQVTNPSLFKTTVIANAKKPSPYLFLESLGKKEGAPNAIQKIIQDRAGFMWLILPEGQGIMRFDGSKWLQFINDPTKPNSFPASSVFDVLEDNQGKIWFSTEIGSVKYNPNNEKFSTVPFVGKPENGSLFEDSHQRIWQGSEGNGVYYLDKSRDSLRLFAGKGITDGYSGKFYPDNSFDKFSNFAETEDGLIWSIAMIFSKTNLPRTAILSFNPNKHDIRFYLVKEVFNQKPKEESPILKALYHDKVRNCFWMGGFNSGLLRFSLNDHSFERFYFSNNPEQANDIMSITPRNDHQLWLGTYNGLKIFDISSQQLYPINTDVGTNEGTCFNVFKDVKGTFWFAYNTKLVYLSNFRQQFPIENQLPLDFKAECIVENPTTKEQIFLSYNEKSNFKVVAKQPNSNIIRSNQQNLNLPHLTDGNVWVVKIAKDGKIWIGLDGGVGCLDPQTLQLTIPKSNIERFEEKLRSDQLWISDLFPDDNGDVWMANWNAGIVQYESKSGQFIAHTKHLGGTTTNLINEVYRSIIKDSKGNWFFGSMGTGLEIWNPNTNELQQYAYNPKNPKSIGGRFVNCMKTDKKGQIWLGTEIGLSLYLPLAPKDSAFERTNVPQTTVYAIETDNQDRIWLKTSLGLILYDPKVKQTTIFGENKA